MSALAHLVRAVTAFLVACSTVSAGAGAEPHRFCAFGRGPHFSGGEEYLTKAQRCAEGDSESCRGLDWIVGMGPADLDEIPVELATRAEAALARQCSSGDTVACANRGGVLLRLGRKTEALALYRSECRAEWPRCLDAGQVELEAGHLREALGLFARVCDAAHDGDAGASCGCVGEILERLSRKAGAATAMETACSRGDNEACSAAWRLRGRAPKAGSWEGLHRSPAGRLLVEDKGDGHVVVRMRTLWANGHTCGYAATGSVTPDAAELRLDAADERSDCRTVLARKGREITIADPDGRCRSRYCGVRGVFEGTFTKTESAPPSSR